MDDDDLKVWLQSDIQRSDKLLLILERSAKVMTVAEIKEAAGRFGLRVSASWNVSQILSRSKGSAIRVLEGWEITKLGKQRLRSLGITQLDGVGVRVASDLRSHLATVADREVANFLEEAIRCFESNFLRSSVVMAWMAAIAVLQRSVFVTCLVDFNREAARLDPRWKPVKTHDDFGRMGEHDFLDRLASISFLGKNRKDELQKCLKLRNACGHPNSLRIGPNMVASHIECLILNVFEPYGGVGT